MARRGSSRRGYRYVVHVTETVESQVTVESDKELKYDEIIEKGREAYVRGEAREIGTHDVRMCLDDIARIPAPGKGVRRRVA